MNDEDYEVTQLSNCIDQFSGDMKFRVIQKAKQGFRGWDDEGVISDSDIRARVLLAIEEARKLFRPLPKTDKPKSHRWVDVANFAMFMWYRENGREKEPEIGDK